MKIENYPAFARLDSYFKEKGYQLGRRDPEDIHLFDHSPVSDEEEKQIRHYAFERGYGRFHLVDISPARYTRNLFIYGASGLDNDMSQYIAQHPELFDRQFYMDYIATHDYSLEFEHNAMAIMPLDYIDEEMAMATMFTAINYNSMHRRGDWNAWFFSLCERKPEVLNKDMYILAARYFARKPDRNGHIKLLDLTPEEYRDDEFYLALCDDNGEGTMELVPEHFRCDSLLKALIETNPCNIQCFTNDALEKAALNRSNTKQPLTYWQVALLMNGEAIRYLELNDERIKFFMEHYKKSSTAYEYCFKPRYKEYRRKQHEAANPQSRHSSSRNDASLDGLLTLALAFNGVGNDKAIDTASEMSRRRSGAGSNSRLPIDYYYPVPALFQDKLDKEEYLLAIYKQIGIEVDEFDCDNYYYNVKPPEGFHVEKAKNSDYELRNKDNEVILTFNDYGPFYDRSVYVHHIYVELDPATVA